jgi:excinuclease ABC subunit A
LDAILLKGVRTHNLKNFDLILPHKKFYVITGVSGSGKSSLAFDTLYAEGQRRYVESLSAYARQFLERMEKPELDGVSGIPPAIAIQAKNVITNARSTVGTQTEINDYLRVFFARVGRTICLRCGDRVEKQTPEKAVRILVEQSPAKKGSILFPIQFGERGAAHFKEFLPELVRQGFTDIWSESGPFALSGFKPGKEVREIWVVVDSLVLEAKAEKRLVDSLELAYQLGKGEAGVGFEGEREPKRFSERFRCDRCQVDYREPTPNLFSFNSPLGACPTCQGFGRVITIDWDRVIPDVRKSVEEGAIEPWTKPSAHEQFEELLSFCRRKKIPIDTPWKNLSEAHRKVILEGTGKPSDNYYSVKDFFNYLETKTYKMHVRVFLSRYRGYILCGDCGGRRLKPDALAVRVAGKTIADFSALPLGALHRFFEKLNLDPGDLKKVEPVLLEIRKRVRFLTEVGLSYLTLDRLSRTLSGGEVERIHLATSLGSSLVDTLYVLDEPSIGLHERDNELLIRLLKELRDLGNTVVVVEHDRTMIEAADEVIDLGPWGGERGGELVFQGNVEELSEAPNSLTGKYLTGRLEIGWKRREPGTALSIGEGIEILGAREHNLHSLDVKIPFGQFVVVTGVSGSGKSTLVYDVLYQNYLRHRGRPVQDLGQVREIRGLEKIDEMILVDQAPIGRTPRSNPMTYVKAFDEIRKVFGASEAAFKAGFEARHFSFNVEGGRCEECKGDGRVKIEMHFLADVYLPCEACGGRRFKREVLEVRYLGKTIDDVLQMTVDEALLFFGDRPFLQERLGILQQVGLGYLRLGQSAPTLSGGEAQRLKLAFEMGTRRAERILYLFDEPTTGLHYHDIYSLMGAFEELLGRGHSVLVIEHNLEVIQCADWIIDLGPEGGEEGGRVVYAGPREGILDCEASYTGRFLKRHLTKKKLRVPV